jgi:hypothetical protein
MKQLPQNPSIRLHKDNILVLKLIENKVEKGTGYRVSELKNKYTEIQLFYIALKYVTTTKKALCTAIKIPIEAGCRYKRKLEKDGLLVQSIDEEFCPLTNNMAHLLSTNPNEFEVLTKSKSNQFKMF